MDKQTKIDMSAGVVARYREKYSDMWDKWRDNDLGLKIADSVIDGFTSAQVSISYLRAYNELTIILANRKIRLQTYITGAIDIEDIPYIAYILASDLREVKTATVYANTDSEGIARGWMIDIEYSQYAFGALQFLNRGFDIGV